MELGENKPKASTPPGRKLYNSSPSDFSFYEPIMLILAVRFQLPFIQIGLYDPLFPR